MYNKKPPFEIRLIRGLLTARHKNKDYCKA